MPTAKIQIGSASGEAGELDLGSGSASITGDNSGNLVLSGNSVFVGSSYSSIVVQKTTAGFNQWGVIIGTGANSLGALGQGVSGQLLTSQGNAAPIWTNLVEEFTGQIESPAASPKVYVLDQKAAFGYVINTLDVQTSAGSCSVAIYINGTVVTGLSAVGAVSGSDTTGTASAANTVAAGNNVTMQVSSISGAADLAFTMQVTRS